MDKDDIIFTKRYSVAATTNKERDDILNDREVKIEYINLMGQKKRVYRLYERLNPTFGGVGWIMNDDIDNCMMCGEEFYFFRRRHHCRSCGNLVCDSCSPDFVIVEELKEQGEVRVCVQCYWGQYPVHVMRSKESDSDDDDDDENDDDDSLNMAIHNSQVNAAANSSTKAVSVEIEDFLEYCDTVVLESGFNWHEICNAIWTGLQMPVHMIPAFEYFVIVDEDGDEVSPYITDETTFWQFAKELSPINNSKIVACVDPSLKQRLFQRRKELLQEMKSPNKDNTLSSSVGKAFPSVSDDSFHEKPDVVVTSDDVITLSTPSTPQTVNGTKAKKRQMRRASISHSDEALIHMAKQRNESNTPTRSASVPHGNSSSGPNGNASISVDTEVNLEEETNDSDIEDTIDETLFNSVNISDGPTPIVDVNPKDHTVVVQLKSGKTNKMSKTDSESLILARRAIADTHVIPDSLSSPAHFAVVEDHIAKKKFDVDDSIDNGEGSSEDTFEVSSARLINSFQKELKNAFDELVVLSKLEDSSICDSLLSLSSFMQWSEVTRAMTEISGLDASLIEEEFEMIASPSDVGYNKFKSPLINFEGFCVLMERLETLGDRRSVIVRENDQPSGVGVSKRPHPTRRYSLSNIDLTSDENLIATAQENPEDINIPQELVEAYENLVEITQSICETHHHTGSSKGVSVSAILQWSNIQEALAADVLEAEDIMKLFSETVENNVVVGCTGHPVLMSLTEFYTFAVKLQVLVDEKCGAW